MQRLKQQARHHLPTWLYNGIRTVWGGVLARGYRLSWRMRGVHIEPTAQFLGWRSIRIGRGSVVSQDCCLTVNHRQTGAIAIDIGSNVFIARRNEFSSGTLISLGDYVLTTADCRFLGSGHRIEDPFLPYAATGSTSDGTIRIGANCWLGQGVYVIGDVSIGHGSVIGARALVLDDIPPFSVVVGSPARVIKRFDMRRRLWVPVAEFTDELAALLPTEADYLVTLRANAPRFRLPRIVAGARMGDLP